MDLSFDTDISDSDEEMALTDEILRTINQRRPREVR